MHPAQLATLLKFDREQTTMFKRLYMPYAVEKKPGLKIAKKGVFDDAYKETVRRLLFMFIDASERRGHLYSAQMAKMAKESGQHRKGAKAIKIKMADKVRARLSELCSEVRTRFRSEATMLPCGVASRNDDLLRRG